MSPWNPHASGFAVSMVKVVKYLLTCASYSGQDPKLALLSYHSMPVDVLCRHKNIVYFIHIYSII